MTIRWDRVALMVFAMGISANCAPGANAAKLEQVAVFETGDVHARPAVTRDLGRIEVYVCRKSRETPASKEEALEALKARAAGMNANGVIAVRFDRARLSLLDRRCWQRLAVSGDAVTFTPRGTP